MYYTIHSYRKFHWQAIFLLHC